MGSRAERHENKTESNGLRERERERERTLVRNGIGTGQKLLLVKWSMSFLSM